MFKIMFQVRELLKRVVEMISVLVGHLNFAK